MAKKQPTPEEVEAALVRWRTKLKRAFGTVDRLEKQRRRVTKPRPPVTMIAIAAPQIEPEKLAEATAQKPDPLEIPDWLKRDKADTEARAQIEAEQANQRLARSRANASKLKAKKAGDLKKMPLSGKAALDHIRNG